MTIDEAMRCVSNEYDTEVREPKLHKVMKRLMFQEYGEIDLELPSYVAEICRGCGVTIIPDYVYQVALMCFRFGMRTQRKINSPNQRTSAFWRSTNAFMQFTLPAPLEFVEHDGELIYGMGPYTIFVRNKSTGQIKYVEIPAPDSTEPSKVKHFMRELEKAIEEQLDADFKRG